MLRKRHDWIGRRFGDGVIIKELGTKSYKNGKYLNEFQNWRLRCDCGNKYELCTKYLTGKNFTKSCGCNRREDLTDKEFGELTVIKYSRAGTRGIKSKRPTVIYLCRCSCGNTVEVCAEYLTNGETSSCGCKKIGIWTHSKNGPCTIKNYLKKIKQWGKKRNKSFDSSITVENLQKLLEQQNYKCAISGLPITLEISRTASLDRKDSSKPYTIDNVQWVYYTINFMKQTLSDEVFISLCHTISDYQRKI